MRGGLLRFALGIAILGIVWPILLGGPGAERHVQAMSRTLSGLELAPASAGMAPANALVMGTVDDQSLRKTDKLAPALDKLYRLDLLSRGTAHRPVSPDALTSDLSGFVAAKQMRIDDVGRVQVWIETTDTTRRTLADLVRLNMEIQRTDDPLRLMQGLLPIAQLAAAAALSSVTHVRLPDYGVVQIGSKLTQGDTILGASTLRSQLTASGRGTRVGVISDGLEGLAASQASSDLGVVDTATCNMAPGSASPTASGAGAEGTAMSEIVHDIVPDAQIVYGYFGANVGGTALDFNAAVNCLAQHTDVVVDDIGWFNAGPYDGTGVVSQNTSSALNNLANPIRGYYTAVANQAMNHYRDAFVNSTVVLNGSGADFWGIHRFQATANTTDGGFGFPCPNPPGGFCGDRIQVSPGGGFSVLLQWNDPFGNSTNDYDLLFYDETSAQFFLASANRQTGAGHDPTEQFAVTNTHGTTTNYDILIGNYKNLAAARTFDMYILCTGCAGFPTGLPAPDNLAAHNFNSLGHSVPNESDSAGGVLSVGAISAANSPSFNTIDSYSSRGPTADGRTKPDLTGIDCVNVTGNGGFPSDFCGTSAAAPHVASIAALLLSCNPTLLSGKPGSVSAATARTTLRTALLNGAVDLGAAGVDNTFGAGRVNTMNSAALAGCIDTDHDGYPDGLETTLGKDPNTYCAIMRADLNGDGVVNTSDLTLFAAQFGKAVPPAPPRDDQNADNAINTADLTLFAHQFAKSVASCS